MTKATLPIGALVFVAVAASCPARSPHPASAQAGLGWLAGHWVAADDSRTETWAKLDPVHVGVGFEVSDGSTELFEIMFVHEIEGGTTYTAMPGGERIVDFAQHDAGPGSIGFENPAHDSPQRIAYRRSGETLHIELSGGGDPIDFELRAAPPRPAPALEAADVEFDADSSARGGVAWAERFEPDGENVPYGGDRTTGGAAIAAMIDGLGADGLALRWAPSTSGLSPAGDMGFTAGVYTVARGGEVIGGGTYVTLWRRGADGAWRIPFDTGVSAKR